MQRIELEQMRQQDANTTALKALQGTRKKPRLDLAGEEGSTFSGTFTQKQVSYLFLLIIKPMTHWGLYFILLSDASATSNKAC